MKALQSLTKLFTTSVVDAKNVEVWAEFGEIGCTQGLSVDGFDIAYTVNINMSDVEVQPQTLMMHLVMWLNQYDIDRQSKGLEPPGFATQLLDNGRCDIKLKVDIKETYSLQESASGVWKQSGARFDCVSDFALAAIEEELPPFAFIGPCESELSPCD